MVKILPANAGNMGSILGLGRSHMQQSSYVREPQLLSLGSRAQGLQLLKPTCHNYKERSYHSPEPEKSLSSNDGPTKPKINK